MLHTNILAVQVCRCEDERWLARDGIGSKALSVVFKKDLSVLLKETPEIMSFVSGERTMTFKGVVGGRVLYKVGYVEEMQ
jgi:hypothetical protein